MFYLLLVNGLLETSPSSAYPRVASTGRLDRARQKTNFCLLVVFSCLRIDRSSTAGIRNKPRLIPVANLSGQLAQKSIGFLGGPNPRQPDDMIASFFRALRECDSLAPLLPQNKIHFTSSLCLRTILSLSLVFRTRSIQLHGTSSISSSHLLSGAQRTPTVATHYPHLHRDTPPNVSYMDTKKHLPIKP